MRPWPPQAPLHRLTLHLRMQAGFKESNSPEGVTAMHELYGRSWFCLMPPGDSHSRRSIYDCLLQDAIPVVRVFGQPDGCMSLAEPAL